MNKKEARAKFMLPEGKKLILFGSLKITDKRKGVDYLIEACKLLAEKHPEWKKAYLTKDSQEAKHTFKYLQMLCGEQQKE